MPRIIITTIINTLWEIREYILSLKQEVDAIRKNGGGLEFNNITAKKQNKTKTPKNSTESWKKMLE